MEARRLNYETDYALICQWHEEHGEPVPPKDLLPETGFIVDGLMAGFVYKTECPIVILDSFIGNPNSDGTLRAEATHALFKAMLKYTKEIGAKHVLALSKAPTLMDRSKDHGFRELYSGLTLFCRGVE